MWGVANNLNDILIKQFQKAFTLDDFHASLVQSAFYTGYFVASLPAAFVVRAYGYKSAVILGLSFFSLGAMLFYPASLNGGSYPGFLGSLYCIAIGLAFLETSANVWVVLLGNLEREGSGTQALNIAQSFNPLGCVAGVVLGRFFILTNGAVTHAQEAAQAGMPYLILAAVVGALAVAVALTSFPESSTSDSQEQLTFPVFKSCISRLWQNGGFKAGVVALFFYVGGQVAVWSFVIRFSQKAMPGLSDGKGADLIVVSLVLFVLGRFAASALLSYINEFNLLAVFAGLACASCVTAATVGGAASVAALCFISFFMSMQFPTIFGTAISKVEREDQPIAGSLLIMGIIGGAVVPPVMGALSDATSIAVSYLVPACCFLGVAGYGIGMREQCEESERKHIL